MRHGAADFARAKPLIDADGDAPRYAEALMLCVAIFDTPREWLRCYAVPCRYATRRYAMRAIYATFLLFAARALTAALRATRCAR